MKAGGFGIEKGQIIERNLQFTKQIVRMSQTH
jgi:hypothetical protein